MYYACMIPFINIVRTMDLSGKKKSRNLHNIYLLLYCKCFNNKNWVMVRKVTCAVNF